MASGEGKWAFVDPALLGINVSKIPGWGLVSNGNLPSNIASFGQLNNTKNKKSTLKKYSNANLVIHSEKGLLDYVVPMIRPIFDDEIAKNKSQNIGKTLKRVINDISPTFGSGLTASEKYFIFNKILGDIYKVPELSEKLSKKTSRIDYDHLASRLLAEALAILNNTNMEYVRKVVINDEEYNEIDHHTFAALRDKVHKYIQSKVNAETYDRIQGDIEYKLGLMGPNTMVDNNYTNPINKRATNGENKYNIEASTIPIGMLGSEEFKTRKLGGKRKKKTRRGVKHL